MAEPAAAVHADELAELERVLSSPAFAGALAHQRLLRYLVEQQLAGNEAQLKETVLGIEVFLRPADSFDPRRDSIVRVEARRLRERLRRHYQDVPAGAPRLVLPKGSYRVQFVSGAGDVAQDPAVELVERGHYFLRQGHEDGHRKALERFEAAARLAPELAAAHGGIARAWLQLVTTNLEPPRPGVDHALVAARRALALQPTQAEPLVLVAQMTHRFEFDWPAARALIERALRVAPESAYVRHTHAMSLMLRGDFDAAEAELAQARQLDPMHLGLRAHQGLLHLYRRHWSAAEAALRALLDMSPDNVLGMSLLAYVELCRGDAAAALARYAEVSRAHPQLSIGIAGEAQALAALGRKAAARQRLAALREGWAGRYLSPYQMAMAEVRLGAVPAALTQLERAVSDRDPNALCLPVDPAFEPLYGEPRFAALAAQVLGRAFSAPATDDAAVAASMPGTG
jgi:tetratricopeptide (TPR) repeat protein